MAEEIDRVAGGREPAHERFRVGKGRRLRVVVDEIERRPPVGGQPGLEHPAQARLERLALVEDGDDNVQDGHEVQRNRRVPDAVR